jgi:hypothetical protein
VHTSEQRLRSRCRRECVQRRSLLPATGVQHAVRQVQEHRGGRLNVCGADLPGAVQPAFPLVELAHPDGHAADRAQRGCEYRSIVQAIAFGQGYRLVAAVTCCGVVVLAGLRHDFVTADRRPSILELRERLC